MVSKNLSSPSVITAISFSNNLVGASQNLITQYEAESKLRKDQNGTSANSHSIKLFYSNNYYVNRLCEFNKESQRWEKNFYPKRGPKKKGLGDRHLWNCYHEDDLKQAKGKWIGWHEGEKATDYMRNLGLISTCIVGSGYKCPIIIKNALTAVAEYEIAGVIYFADEDDQGIKRANYIKVKASKMGIPFIILPIKYLFSCSTDTEPEQGDDFVEYLASLPEEERDAKHIRAYILDAIDTLSPDFINPIEPESNNKSKDDIEPKTTWLKIAMQQIFTESPWMYSAGNFYRYNGRNYEHKCNDEVEHLISEWCATYTVRNAKGELYYPHYSPEKVTKIFKWAKKRLWIHPNELNPNGLPFANGILTKVVLPNDEIEFLLEPHSPDKYYTFCSEVEYNPNVDLKPAQELLECLDEPYRTLVIETLATMLGADLIRSKHDRVKGLILVGEGANGKDTVRTVISHLLGKKGITNCNLNDFRLADNGRAFNLNRLASNPRINWSSENKSLYIDSIQTLKQAITGDPIFIEGKGKEGTDIELNTLFIFNANEKPTFSGEQTAIQSRFEIVPFNKVYSLTPNAGELRANPRYKHDRRFLIDQVCPGMLNLLVEAYKRVYHQGINYQKTNRFTQEIMEKNNHLRAFANDVGLVFTGNPEDMVSCKEIFGVLENWYIGEDILTLEDNKYDPDKLDKVYHGEEDFKYDKLIKAPRQVSQRFLKLFPKAKVVKDKISRRSCLVGIAFIDQNQEAKTPIEQGMKPNSEGDNFSCNLPSEVTDLPSEVDNLASEAKNLPSETNNQSLVTPTNETNNSSLAHKNSEGKNNSEGKVKANEGKFESKNIRLQSSDSNGSEDAMKANEGKSPILSERKKIEESNGSQTSKGGSQNGSLKSHNGSQNRSQNLPPEASNSNTYSDLGESNGCQNPPISWKNKIGVKVQSIHDDEIAVVEEVDNFGTLHVRFIDSAKYDDKELYPIHPDNVREI